jgi:hypothetical protein
MCVCVSVYVYVCVCIREVFPNTTHECKNLHMNIHSYTHMHAHTLTHIYMYSLSLPTHTNTLTHSHKHSISPSFLLYPHLNLFINEHGKFLSKNGNKQAPLMDRWVEVS